MNIILADLDDPSHARAVTELIDDYASGIMGGGRSLSADVLESLVPGLRRHPTHLVLLAEVDDAFVGVAVCFVGFSTFAARPLINIHDLAVRPSHQGRGLGKRLLAAVEARARDLGCCKITLEVREDNQQAMGLYQKVGFLPGDAAGAESGVRQLFWHKPLLG